nr:MAG TPA: hypothetical protein [Caudoviricetes sp.]
MVVGKVLGFGLTIQALSVAVRRTLTYSHMLWFMDGKGLIRLYAPKCKQQSKVVYYYELVRHQQLLCEDCYLRCYFSMRN